MCVAHNFYGRIETSRNKKYNIRVPWYLFIPIAIYTPKCVFYVCYLKYYCADIFLFVLFQFSGHRRTLVTLTSRIYPVLYNYILYALYYSILL